MSVEPVIDLDEPSSRTAGRRDARRRVTRKVVAALLAGIVLGGAGMFALREHRTDEASLVVLPALTSGGESDVDGIFSVEGQLAIVNTGAVPVTVRLVDGEGPGITVRSSGPEPEIRPGGTGWIGVRVRTVRAVRLGTEEVSLKLSASVGDGEPQEAGYPIAFLNSAWGNEAQAGCELMTP